MAKIEIKFDRINAIYKPGETVAGSVIVLCPKKKLKIELIHAKASGKLYPQNPTKSDKMEYMINDIKSRDIFEKVLFQANNTHKLNERNEFCFKFQLKDALMKSGFMESYIGVYCSVNYMVEVDIVTAKKNEKAIKQKQMFFVTGIKASKEHKQLRKLIPRPFSISLKNDTIDQKTLQGKKLTDFNFKIQLKSTICQVGKYIEGTITIKDSQEEVQSVDLQLLRDEQVQTAKNKFKEVTEILNLQVIDGNPLPGWQIPIHVQFPRSFVCPEFTFKEYTVKFSFNVIFLLKNNFLIRQNVPLQVIR